MLFLNVDLVQENSGTKKLANKHNNFERGKEDVFVLELAELGTYMSTMKYVF